MVFELFRGRGESQVERIEERLQEMLAACRQTLDMACDSVGGRMAAADVGETLRKTDRSINRNERSIRRELVVHSGVRGAAADVPLILIYMSISKDIERVGDYSKNIWDLANAGVDLSRLPEWEAIDRHGVRTRELVDAVADIFRRRDADAAAERMPELDGWLDEYDAIVEQQLGSDRPSHDGVPVALFYRYLKRITAHLMNVLTSLVMPLDRIDFWDEDKIDRW